MKKTEPKSKKNAGNRRRVETDIPKSAENIADKSPVQMKKVIDELQVRQVELQTQNEALRKSQIEFADLHRKYSNLYDFAPVGYLTLNRRLEIIETNVIGASLLGGTKRAIPGQTFLQFISSGFVAAFQEHLQQAILTKKKQKCRMKLLGKYRYPFEALIDTVAVVNTKGKLDHWRCSFTDIRDIARMEEALRESEQRYRHIVEDGVEFIGRANVDGTITFVNRALWHHFSMNRKEFLGRKVIDFIPDEDREVFLKFLSTLTRQNPVADIELRVIMPNGDMRWHLWTVRAIYSLSSRFIEFQGFGHDITDRRQAEKALLASRQEIQTILESMTDIYLVLDCNWRIIEMNSEAEKIIKVKRGNLLGKVFWDLFPQAVNNDFYKHYHIAMEAQVPVHFEGASDIFPGVWFEAHAYPSQKGLSIFSRDVTERKKIEEVLKKHLSELEAANKDLESFSYSVSHDLRAPLRAIDGYARMILKKQGDTFDEETLRKFNEIRLNAHMMGQLIDDLLTFSRLGRKHMSTANLDMNALIGDVWKELTVINPEREITLTMSSLPSCHGDRTLMRQVYANLLSNAVKFTRNRDAARIEVGGYTDGDEVIYYVRDNGVGFDMTYYDKLFGVFQRLHSTDDFEGTGIGLALVKRIVHRHGGRVWAEGKINEGSIFYFTLPHNGDKLIS